MAVHVSINGKNCHNCTEREKKQHGYYGLPEGSKLYRFSGGVFGKEGECMNKCIGLIPTNKSREFISAYSHYQDGILPEYGGWNDQTHPFQKAIRIIKNEVAEQDGK